VLENLEVPDALPADFGEGIGPDPRKELRPDLVAH
jgi:hypothetical protein